MSSFKEWYDNGGNKKLSKKRKERYKNDPLYRQNAINKAADRRKLVKLVPPPDGYVCTLEDVAKRMGCSIWTVREWRRKNYFPEPLVHKGRMMFTEQQLLMLWKLFDFFLENGKRLKEADKDKLDNLVAIVYSNW